MRTIYYSRPVSLGILFRICEYLDCSIDDIVFTDKEKGGQ